VLEARYILLAPGSRPARPDYIPFNGETVFDSDEILSLSAMPRSMIVVGGGGRLVAFTCVGGHGQRLMPCGRCRQLLWEHGGAELLVDTPEGILTMSDILPQAFGPEDLQHEQ
jgi:hypothetical protein